MQGLCEHVTVLCCGAYVCVDNLLEIGFLAHK